MDKRGKFSRLICQKQFKEIGHNLPFIQVNRSVNIQKGGVRGMHYQYPPKSEIKVVTCIKGRIFDVIIDLRQHSDTFFNWHGEVLSEENGNMMYIPKGFAHGFQTLEENCELLYFHTEVYSPEYEGSVKFNDPKIGIKWPLKATDLSDKDKNLPNIPENYMGIQ